MTKKILLKIFLRLLLLIFIPLSLFAFTIERDEFLEAESDYFNKNYMVALEKYDEFIKRFPLSDLLPDAQYRKAICLFRLKRYDEAIKIFKAVEKRYRSTRYIDYVPFWKGITYFQLGDYADSEKNLNTFLKVAYNPDFTPKALLHKALIAISLENLPEAMESMKKLINEKGIESISPYEAVLYSYLLLKEKSYDELIRFSEGLNINEFIDESKERIYLYRAEAYYKNQEIKKAEEIYRKLVSGSKKASSVSYRRLYIIAQNRGDLSQMEWIPQRAEEKFAQSPEILKDLWLRTGIECFKRGELDLSKHFLSKVLNLKDSETIPEAAVVYLSEIYIKKGEPGSAKKILEEYIKISEKYSSSVLLRLGNLYLNTKDYSSAKKIFLEFIKINPNADEIWEARYLLAYSEYKIGEFNDALFQCQLILNENVNNLKRDSMRLKAIILKTLGRIRESYETLNVYVKKYPDDIRAHLDLLKLLYAMKNYQDALSVSDSFIKDFPDLKRSDIYAFIILNYLRGLSQMAIKSYRDSLDSFSLITENDLEKASCLDILPYIEYYTGWAIFRLGDFEKAAEIFLDFTKNYPSHELYYNAFYFGAWCCFRMGDYNKAHELFKNLARIKGNRFSEKAWFLDGKSLLNLKRREDALKVFYKLYTESPKSIFADDSLFEYAGILAEIGKIEESAKNYLKVFNEYPQSPLAREALYKRGELYYLNGMYREAKNAFNDYRRHFSKGELIDASLYWEALASYELNEIREALLLWEIIINSYKKSSFRPDSIKKAADVWVSLGDFQNALEMYTMLINSYPDYSHTVNAELRLREIRYLIFGLNKKEAELTAVISKKGGVKTRDGREAMIDLARIYIFEEEDKLERAFQLLIRVLQEEDTITQAKSQLLLGEYYFRKGDPMKAGKEFYKASLKNTGDSDFMAYSIFKAAQMMKICGKLKEANALVKRLEDSFPQTEWAKEAKRLLGELE